MIKYLNVLVLLLIGTVIANAQERTIGLVDYDESTEPGIYLFSPKGSTTTYVVNECGGLVNQWPSVYKPGLMERFTPDGNIVIAKELQGFTNLGTGGSGGLFLMMDWNRNPLWQYYVATDSMELAHHDFLVMPNGNILFIAWDWKSGEEAISQGRDPDLLPYGFIWPEKLVEVRPIFPDSAEVVWEWYQWDHMIQDFDSTKANYGVVEDHPELWDINFAPNPFADWLHLNAIDYDQESDQIVVCSRDLGEVYVIDHSTTTEEAAGHTGGRWGKGGDILYRYGNPQAYRRGDSTEQVFFEMHGANFVDRDIEEAWDIVVFNNGVGRPGENYSDVIQISPERAADSSYLLEDGRYRGTHKVVYEADPPTDFYARFLSAAEKVSNDKYLISDGPAGTFFEVDTAMNVTWKYIVPVSQIGPLEQGYIFAPVAPGNPTPNFSFRCTKYDPEDQIFDGIDLTSESYIELQALESLCTIDTSTNDTMTTGIDLDAFAKTVAVYPNPVHRGGRLNIRNASKYSLETVSLVNTASQEISADFSADRSYINSFEIPATIRPGIYLLRFEFDPDTEKRLIYRKLVVY